MKKPDKIPALTYPVAKPMKAHELRAFRFGSYHDRTTTEFARKSVNIVGIDESSNRECQTKTRMLNWPPTSSGLRLILNQRPDIIPCQFLSSWKEFKFDHENQSLDLSAETFN